MSTSCNGILNTPEKPAEESVIDAEVNECCQVDIGKIISLKDAWNVLVVAEGWPSWTFAAAGLGLKIVNTKLVNTSLSTLQEVKQMTIGTSIITDTIDQWINATMSNGRILLLFQTSHSVLKNLINDCPRIMTNPFIFVCQDQNFFCADCVRISHKSVGGITTGIWSCHFNNLLSFDIMRSNVRRSLVHVLDYTQGESREEKSNSTPGPLLANQLLPFGKQTARVKCKSVFHGEQLIERHLTDKEIYNCYDLEKEVQDDLRSYYKDQDLAPSFGFTKQVPLKVVRAILMSFTESLAHVEEKEEVESLDSQQTITVTNLTSDVNERLNLDTDGDNTVFMGEDDMSLEEDTSQLLAARPNDVEAEAKDWDEWIVRSWDNNLAAYSLVCVGNYDPFTHGVLFDRFRQLLLRRYKRNVLKSFLRYLHRSYAITETMTVNVGNTKLNLELPGWINPNFSRSINLARDLDVGKDAVMRTSNSSWWDWSAGSTLLFWRWPDHLMKKIRDGSPLFIIRNNLPRYMRRQRWPKEEILRNKLLTKLSKVRKRGYVSKGYVKSLTNYFAVPKALIDIELSMMQLNVA